ncbi:hypothetical protein PHISCL_00672 [Aspergillus sclerotialis]|uniref:Uncharacterized protein n=1 Tax=Aspergillus sclerotialis TaxID=2070753 RepID=A0A3A3ACC8_9EURO|nr:hypothetical protein PHISCL_00672 [Aspergillus sclerotialis]
MSEKTSTSGTTSSDSSGFPNPRFRYAQFELSKLPDPPRSWNLDGKPPSVILRDTMLTKEMLSDIFEYHFWGIDPGISGKASNISKMKALYKLVYYQAPYHRASGLGDLCEMKIDAGPRLLSCKLENPCALPVSRWYPNLPDEYRTRIRPDFVRPPDAAAEQRDIWLQQHLLSSKTRPGREGIMSSARYRRFRRRRQKKINARRGKEPAAAPRKSVAQQAQQARPTTSMARLSGFNAKEVIDAVERAVLRFAYVDVERHPSATPHTSRPHITATGDENLLRAIIGSSQAVAYVRATYDAFTETWDINPEGNAYPCRGRGPVYRNNSSAVDCAIVVGRLLDAGSTVMDRKDPNWHHNFSDAERAFIEATDVNWDVCTPDDSADIRDALWEVLAEADPKIGVGNVNPFWTIWSTCTQDFAQFQFRYTQSVTNCQCSGLGITTEQFDSSFVLASLREEEAPGVSMQELVARFFAPLGNGDCPLCNSPQSILRHKHFSSLPMRMVVLCDDKRVKNHTKNLEFTYADATQTIQTAKYRWMGGVYYKNGHFRVVWSDVERGEKGTGELRYYDSKENHGLIIGGIQAAHRDEKVPGSWMGDGIFPMLIYERIQNPEPEVLDVAAKSIQDMIACQKREQFILDLHTPWNQPAPITDLQYQLWTRILPEYGQRFYTAAGGRLRNLPGRRNNTNKDPAVRRAEPSFNLTHAYMNEPLARSTPNPLDQMCKAIALSETMGKAGVNQFFLQAPYALPQSYSNYQGTPVNQFQSPTMMYRPGSAMQLDTESQGPTPAQIHAQTQTHDLSQGLPETIRPEKLTLPPITSLSWANAGCGQERETGGRVARDGEEKAAKGKNQRKLSRVEKAMSRKGTRKSARLSGIGLDKLVEI